MIKGKALYPALNVKESLITTESRNMNQFAKEIRKNLKPNI